MICHLRRPEFTQCSIVIGTTYLTDYFLPCKNDTSLPLYTRTSGPQKICLKRPSLPLRIRRRNIFRSH